MIAERVIPSLQAGVAPSTRVLHLVVKLGGCARVVSFALFRPGFGINWRTGRVVLAGWRLECLALGRVMKWLFAMSAASMIITRHADV